MVVSKDASAARGLLSRLQDQAQQVPCKRCKVGDAFAACIHASICSSRMQTGLFITSAGYLSAGLASCRCKYSRQGVGVCMCCTM